MTAETQGDREGYELTIGLDPGRVPVSYLSSMLRVIQAALREVAQASEGTRARFEQRPPPILLVSKVDNGPELTFGLHFSEASDYKPMERLSAQVFEAFLDELSRFVRQLPQPSLFGGAARGSPPNALDSQVARRMDQVHRELRRSPRVTLSFRKRRVRIEGESMEIT